MAGPTPGTKNRYGEVWDGAQWNDPADDFLSSVSPAPAATPAASASDGFAFKPGESTGAAMLRYGGEEVKGAARSPLDALKGLLQMPGAVVRGWTEAIPALVRDPSLLREAPRAAIDAGTHLAMHPTDLGSLLGQTVLGKAIPEAAPAVADATARGALATTRGTIGATGRVASAVGRGAETIGESGPLRHGSTWGAGAATLSGRPGSAVAMASAPYLLRSGGRLAQRAGSALTDLGGSEALASPEGAMTALQRRLNPPAAPTHGEQLAAGAERYVTGKRAQTAQQAAREAASGLAPDFGERVPVRGTEPVPQAEPGDFPPWTPPPSSAPPPAAAPAPTILDSLRQRSGTGFRPVAPPIAAAPTAATSAVPPSAMSSMQALLERTSVPPVIRVEGEANLRPGEFPPGPAAPGFKIERGRPLPEAQQRTQHVRARATRPTASTRAAETDVDFLSAAEDRINALQAAGREVDPEMLADVERLRAATPASPTATKPRGGPSRGPGGRYGKKVTEEE